MTLFPSSFFRFRRIGEVGAARRRRVARLLGLVLLLALLGGSGAIEPAEAFTFHNYTRNARLPTPDTITARAALLVDSASGEVLYARNPEEHHLPASTTKLMTALIAYEKLGLKGSVIVIPDDTHVEPSSLPLQVGETISIDALMHCLLIESDNDAARALGRAVAGSTDAFVVMMNERAAAMGCYNTHFENPNGLPAPAGTHYTSCADLLKIFNAVIAHPALRQICEIKEYRLALPSRVKTMRNHNLLLGYYPGMGPAKTGWTVAARHTYAAAAVRSGRQLALVLMDDAEKPWRDAQILFNWGFAQKSAFNGSNEETRVVDLRGAGAEGSGSAPIPAWVTMPNAGNASQPSAGGVNP